MKTSEQQQLKIVCPNCGRKLDLSDIPAFTEVECPACQHVIIVPCWYHNFLLEELLLEDGYLRLYRALDPSLDREVVVRVLSAETPPGRREDFLSVVRHGARLVHPNVAQIYSCGEHDGEAFAVSQFVRGVNLRERIKGGTLPQRSEVQAVLQQAVDVLAFAEAKGLFHGHLVPENMLIDEAGELHITDFGLARVLGKSQAANPYRAPEATDDSPATASADMFSLASCIYEFATGSLPDNGNLNHAEGEKPDFPSLAEFGTGLPNVLSQLIQQMLELDAAKRPGGYEEIKEALKQSRTVSQLGHRQVLVGGGGKGKLHIHVTRQPQTILLCKKRGKWSVLNLVLAAAVVVLIVLALLNIWRDGRSSASSETPRPAGLELPKRLQKELAQEQAGEFEPEQESLRTGEVMGGESPRLFDDVKMTSKLSEEVLALRPHPDDLDFRACKEETRKYLEAVPSDLQELERERLRYLGSYKEYLLSKIQKMSSYSPEDAIGLRNGKYVKGTINFMSNEKALKMIPEGSKNAHAREIPWSELKRSEIWKMAAWYIALQQERAGKRNKAAIADEYFYLLLLCDWYGDRKDFDKYAALAEKLGSPRLEQLKSQYFDIEK